MTTTTDQPDDLSPSRYIDHFGKRFEPQSDCVGYLAINALECLKGRPWDEVALAFVSALNPILIRVTKDLCNSRDIFLKDRVTVILDDDGLIKSIRQEVKAWLPDGVVHGRALNAALAHGIDSPQVKFFDDDQIDYYYSDNSGKVLRDGTTVAYPDAQPATKPPVDAGAKVQ